MKTAAFTVATLFLGLAAAFTAGCSSNKYVPADDEDPDSFEAVKDIHGGPYSDMVLVYLKTGPKSGQLSKEQSDQVFAGHMANIHRLADLGQLLIAGPFDRDHTRDKTWRGIFLLDTPNIDLAKLQAESDPGIQAGVFTPEYRQVKASIELRHVRELEKAMLAKTEAEKDKPRDPTKPPPNIRGYVMVTADDAPAANAALKRAGLADKVVWCTRFSGTGPKGYGKGGVFVLDAEKADDVKAALDKAGAPGIGVDGWWATTSLTGLGGSARVMPGG
ncbi:MAG: hypothetical protein QM783_02240 [Phycisphaerales bacterium]